MKRPRLLDEHEVLQALEAHPHWQQVGTKLVRTLRTRDYGSSIAILSSQVGLAESLDHHPIVHVGYKELTLEVWTHDRGGITQLDIDYISGFDELLADFADVLS